MSDFQEEVKSRIASNTSHREMVDSAHAFMQASTRPKYCYNFSWLGRPVIQYPQDIVAVQELIWKIKPDLIIETGIAHGGSLILSASILSLMDMCEAIEAGQTIDPAISKRKVLGVDIDIREHNKIAIEKHAMASRIEMIQGSSIDKSIVDKIHAIAEGYSRILVMLDSNHTHEHVLKELEFYAPLTSPGSYCVVFDTIIEDLGKDTYPDRPWGPGDNPKTAVHEYLKANPQFEIDRSIQDQLLITVAPDGFLKRTG